MQHNSFEMNQFTNKFIKICYPGRWKTQPNSFPSSRKKSHATLQVNLFKFQIWNRLILLLVRRKPIVSKWTGLSINLSKFVIQEAAKPNRIRLPHLARFQVNLFKFRKWNQFILLLVRREPILGRTNSFLVPQNTTNYES